MQPKRLTNMSGVLCSNTGTGQMRTEEDAVKAREPTCISSPACRSSVNEYQAVIALMGALGVTYTRANKTPVALESGSLIVHWRARREVPRGVTFFGGAVTSK
jgi:hypothetical protein